MQIRWTPEAANDLTGIRDYIEQNTGSEAAERVALAIFRAAESLALFSDMGRQGLKPGTREWVVASLPHIIVYRVKSDAVEIIRIVHGARNRTSSN